MIDPSAGSPAALLRREQPALAEDLVMRHFAADPQLEERFGPAGREKCLEDAHYHLSYLADALTAGDPSLFASYVGWAKVMLGTRGIAAEDLARTLELTRTVIVDRLGGPAAALAVEYLDAGLARLPSLPADVLTYLVEDAPLAGLARDYVGALLRGERHVASRSILDAVSSGIPVKEIYLHVFQPAQYEVGRLWQVNEISVGQEHYCTAATQLIMSQLYPHIFASDKGGGTLVGTCVAGDLHEIGMRMVTDFFEMDGWSTFYLGANTPARAVLDTVVQRHAHILGISVTLALHLRAVKELIDVVRGSSACAHVKILVGGYPFIGAPDLWRTLGADGSASDAQAAIVLGNQLIADGGHA